MTCLEVFEPTGSLGGQVMRDNASETPASPTDAQLAEWSRVETGGDQ